MTTSENVDQHFLHDATRAMAQLKRLADQAIERVDDRQLLVQIDAESNSIAVLMKHLGGNMTSRWTDFLATDGEKETRHRDAEFEQDEDTSRAAVVAGWEAGWQTAFAALESLAPADLGRTVVIRGEPHTVIQAIHRQMTHTAYHIGQIVLLAKHLLSSDWTSLSIPRGASERFNEQMKGRQRTV